uniref:dTMP kinase n=1 Tax=Rattus norvegicus TaxID=10116 RepID=A0ABK0L560_RAT
VERRGEGRGRRQGCGRSGEGGLSRRPHPSVTHLELARRRRRDPRAAPHALHPRPRPRPTNFHVTRARKTLVGRIGPFRELQTEVPGVGVRSSAGWGPRLRHVRKRFPAVFSAPLPAGRERSTEIGKLLSSYLEKKTELEDHSVHLLFSANRWEQVPLIKAKLNQGVTLVLDRYAFSGVAFTSAKENFSLDWCKQPDVGLPKPDLILFLQLQLLDAASRGEFGLERYETGTFQEQVLLCFQQLMSEKNLNWKVVDASKSIEDVHEEIRALSEDAIQNAAQRPLEELWK